MHDNRARFCRPATCPLEIAHFLLVANAPYFLIANSLVVCDNIVMPLPKHFFKNLFAIPKEYSEQVVQKNTKTMKFFSYIALGFGIIFSIVFTILYFLNIEIKVLALFYYYSFVVIGGLGLLSLHLKVHVKYMIVFELFFVEFVFLFFMLGSTATNCIIVFLGLSFVTIMFLEVHPVVFTVFLVISVCVFVSFKEHGLFYDESIAHSKTLLSNVTLLFSTLIFLVFWKRKHIVDEFKHDKELKAQQSNTESVLKNIFPEKVIQQMVATGATNAEVYESVSVLCCDIVNFTQKAASLDPNFVIEELNEIFTAFDEISEIYNCMRIKTVGDAYVAVCGIPEENPNHAENIVRCGKEFISYLEEKNKDAKVKWTIRVGVASGKVAAGVVGVKKYVYDIFGETVDRAVKTEESGEIMKVSVSPETDELLKGKIRI